MYGKAPKMSKPKAPAKKPAGMPMAPKLPVRGQRTHTNARTRKGPKKTVANKKIAVRK